jgi:hypothetical protein
VIRCHPMQSRRLIPLSSVTHHGRMKLSAVHSLLRCLSQLPAVLKNNETIPRHSAGSVVVGFKDRQARSVVDVISHLTANGQRDPNLVLSWDKCETRDFADKDLLADSFPPDFLWFEEAVRGENPLPG